MNCGYSLPHKDVGTLTTECCCSAVRVVLANSFLLERVIKVGRGRSRKFFFFVLHDCVNDNHAQSAANLASEKAQAHCHSNIDLGNVQLDSTPGQK